MTKTKIKKISHVFFFHKGYVAFVTVFLGIFFSFLMGVITVAPEFIQQNSWLVPFTAVMIPFIISGTYTLWIPKNFAAWTITGVGFRRISLKKGNKTISLLFNPKWRIATLDALISAGAEMSSDLYVNANAD